MYYLSLFQQQGLCGAGRSQQMAPMNQSTHTLMALSSQIVGWIIHRNLGFLSGPARIFLYTV